MPSSCFFSLRFVCAVLTMCHQHSGLGVLQRPAKAQVDTDLARDIQEGEGAFTEGAFPQGPMVCKYARLAEARRGQGAGCGWG